MQNGRRSRGRRTLAIAAGLAAVLGGSAVAASTPDDSEPDASGASGSDAAPIDQECIDAGLEELVAAAQEEGKVTLYSSQGQDNLGELEELFEAEYEGIDVEFVRDVDSTAIARVETEQNTGNHIADFMVSAAPAWVTERGAEGWFAEPIGPQFTCESGYDTEAYVDEGGVFEVSAVVFSIAWNTDEVPDGLTDYPDLLDPELAGGKIGVVDPSIAPVLADFYTWLERTYGEDYLESLGAQEPRIYPGAAAMQEALISGEIVAATYIAPIPTLVAAMDDGAPVDYAVLDEMWGAKFYGTIIEGAEHPNAAQLFANFMVTEVGQVPIHSGGAVLPNVEGAIAENRQIADVDLAGQEPDALAEFNEYWDSLFR